MISEEIPQFDPAPHKSHARFAWLGIGIIILGAVAGGLLLARQANGQGGMIDPAIDPPATAEVQAAEEPETWTATIAHAEASPDGFTCARAIIRIGRASSAFIATFVYVEPEDACDLIYLDNDRTIYNPSDEYVPVNINGQCEVLPPRGLILRAEEIIWIQECGSNQCALCGQVKGEAWGTCVTRYAGQDCSQVCIVWYDPSGLPE